MRGWRIRANVVVVAAPFCFDRTWWFPVPPDQLWAVFNRTDQYSQWWSWLKEFDTEGFVVGTTAHFVIQSPLPYALRCTIHVDEMRPAEVIVTTVTGDLEGPARLEIGDATDGCTARLVWALTPGNPMLRSARAHRAPGDGVGPRPRGRDRRRPVPPSRPAPSPRPDLKGQERQSGSSDSPTCWSSQALIGAAACRKSTTRSFAFFVPSHAPTGQWRQVIRPFWRSSSMRG